MNGPDLLALAERCEAASGPDRELDAAIVRAVCPGSIVDIYIAGDDEYTVFHAAPLVRDKATLPAFTSSIDAAMTLIPSGANSAGEIWRAEGYSDPGVLAAHVRASAWVAGAARVYAATPALALCAAALRSLATSTGGDSHG